MKVVLTKDVVRLGQRGAIVEVKDGFGRNFLIRQGLARQAVASDADILERQKANIADKKEVEAQTLKEYKKRLSETQLVFSRKANEAGHLFAGIYVDDILEALRRKGFRGIKSEQVNSAPLKTVGEHEASVSLGGEDTKLSIVVNAL